MPFFRVSQIFPAARKNRTAAGIVLLALLISCAQEPPVIKWRQTEISLSDFERAYFNYFLTTQAPDSPELREKFARELLERTLIAQTALDSRIIDPVQFKDKLAQDEARFLRKRYIEVTLKDTLAPPTAAEIDAARARAQVRLRVRQLFAKSKSEIDSLAGLLRQGADFEALARETLPDSQLAVRGGDLGWIGTDDTDLPVENVLFRLQVGEISPPVESLMGWHIFRLDSLQRTLKFGEEHPLARQEAREKLFYRKLEMAAAPRLRELVWSKKLAIQARIFPELWARIAPLLPRTPKQAVLYPFENLVSEMPIDFSSKTLASVDGDPYSVKEFLVAIPELPRELLRPNLKKAIEVAVRDKIIAEIARKKGLDRDPVVKEKVWRAKMTYTYYAALAVRDSLAGKKMNLQEYYEKNQNKFIDFVETEVEEILVKDREQALELAKSIQSGADFAEAARKYSIRDKTRNHGGHLGFVSSQENAIGRQAAKLNEGALYAPIESDDGFSVIRVGKKKVHYQPFEKVKTGVQREMQQEHYHLLHQQALPEAYQIGDVQYFGENLKKAFSGQSQTIF